MTADRPEYIYGIHPVQELLEHRLQSVERILVAHGRGGGAVGRILRLARASAIPVTNMPRELLAKRIGIRLGHQGVAAQVAPIAYADVERICRRAADRPDGLLVLVDRVVDAGNLGAILRTCSAAGVDGVILSSDGTAGLSPGVAKASAGAVERLPVCREGRPARRLKFLRENGFQTLALDPRGESSWDRLKLTGPLVVVAGGEHKGPRPGVLQACERRVAIRLSKKVDSLNVAVSTGVLLFEAVRQRRGVDGGLETSETH
jgi:23S rRNA (guanosine2251-2'-O)-methyltransferase